MKEIAQDTSCIVQVNVTTFKKQWNQIFKMEKEALMCKCANLVLIFKLTT